MKSRTPLSPVTVIDVAREAGVSPSTVSRILNGSARVTAEKKASVERAIGALGFMPNLFARSLKSGRTMTIGLLTQDVESQFFGSAVRGIEAGLAGTGFAAIVASGHWDAGEEAARVRLLMARRIDGLVILGGHLGDEDIIEFARHQPIVVTGKKLTAHNLRSFAFDQETGGYLATRHLLALGHRRIAHIAGPSDQFDATQRRAGYERALREASVPLDPALLAQGDFHEASGMLAMERLLENARPLTAVFAANDQMALGARMALYRRGVRVPEEVSIVGVDDIPAAAYSTPPLTTIRQPIYEIGLAAASALLTMIGHPRPAVTIPALELVIRESTRRP
jgi:LacI family transcriptional regulator